MKEHLCEALQTQSLTERERSKNKWKIEGYNATSLPHMFGKYLKIETKLGNRSSPSSRLSLQNVPSSSNMADVLQVFEIYLKKVSYFVQNSCDFHISCPTISSNT